jgi:cyclase
MLKNRVIPCLLLKNGGLVKTQKFSKPTYVGDPINAIRIFNEKEVDELLVLDIEASRKKQEPNYNLIEQIASECFMPLAYGGGIHSLKQAKTLFSLGVEKVVLQTAVLHHLSLITELANQFGTQAIMVSIDIKMNWLGRPGRYSAYEGKMISKEWCGYIRHVVKAGAGEIILNSVDRDGMMQGMELSLIKEASAVVDVPLVAMGGVGSLAHIKDAVEAGASAVAAGAFFVFHGPHRAVLITYPSYGELEELLG